MTQQYGLSTTITIIAITLTDAVILKTILDNFKTIASDSEKEAFDYVRIM